MYKATSLVVNQNLVELFFVKPGNPKYPTLEIVNLANANYVIDYWLISATQLLNFVPPLSPFITQNLYGKEIEVDVHTHPRIRIS